MNYKIKEYKTRGSNGVVGFSAVDYGGVRCGLSEIDGDMYAAFDILLEPLENCVINNVYLEIEPDYEYKNATLFTKIIPDEDSNDEKIISKGYYEAAKGRYVLDITSAFDGDPFLLKFLRLYSDDTVAFYNYPSSNCPILVVEYIEFHEVLNQEKNIGFTLSDNVSCSSGVSFGLANVVKPLASYGGEAMPHNLVLSYCGTNHNQVNFNGMPKGWILNYQQKVEYNPLDNSYLFTDGSGIKHKFVVAIGSATTFYDVSGSGLILICNSDNTYKIIDGYNNNLTFNSNGLLTKIIKEINLNTLEISVYYDSSNRINRVMDGMGRNIYFDYYSDYVHISGIGMKSYSLKFDSNNLLTKIVESGNQETVIEYDADNRISTFSNYNSEEVVFLYDDCFRVKKVQQKVNKNEEVLMEEISLTYEDKSTLVKDKMNNFTKYIFDNERNIVQVIQDGANIRRIEREQLSKSQSLINKESYRSFIDGCIDCQVISPFYNIHKTDHNGFAIAADKLYALTFKHTATLDLYDGVAIALTAWIEQSDEVLNVFTTVVNPSDPKNEVVYFRTKDKSEVTISFLFEGSNAELQLEEVKIYPCDEQRTRVCIDSNSGSIFSSTIGGKTWYELDSNYKEACYGNDKVTIPGTMYLEDLVETQKNLNNNTTQPYVWYNKKRGLVVSSKAYIKVIDTYLDLKTTKLGIISESDKLTTLNYNDYADVDSFNTEYIVYKSNDSEYTTKTKYNNNFLVNQTEDYNGIVTTYSYDAFSNLLKEEVSNGKDNLKMFKTYTYTNNYLTQETMMVNGTNKSISYEYDLDNGNLLKTTYPDGQVVTNDFNQTTKKLVKISSGTSSNEISYNNDFVTLLKGSGNGHVFEYDKFNMLSKVKHSDDVSLEIETVLDNFEITKTYNLKSTPNTYLKYHYDKFGNLFLTEKSTDNVTFTPSKTLFYSDKEVDLIDDITLPNAQAMNKSSNSKLRKVIDNEVSNTQKFYYDSEGKLNKVTNSLDTYYPTTTTYAYDESNRVTGVEQTFSNDTFSTDIVYKDSLSDEVAKIKGTLDYSCLSVSDSIMSSFTGSLSCEVTNEYDSFGRIANKQYKYSEEEQQLANCKVYYSYQQSNNITNNLISSEYHSAFTSGTFNYTYDSMGQITSVNDGYYTTTYEYDTLGRLKRENNQKLNKTYLYSYDNNGNITYKGEADYTTTAPAAYKHDYFTYSTTTPDLMIKHNNQTISNLNGLPTFDGVRNYTWINGGRLSKLSYSTTKYLDFKYDTDGHRIEKNINQMEEQ